MVRERLAWLEVGLATHSVPAAVQTVLAISVQDPYCKMLLKPYNCNFLLILGIKITS